MALAWGSAAAVIVVLAPSDTLDFNTDATDDLEALNVGSVTAIRELNGTLLAKLADQSPGTTWENVTLSLVQGLNYAAGAPGGEVPQSFPGVFDDIFIYKTPAPDERFYKLRDQGPNGTSGITVEWEFVGSGAPPAPTASFTFESFDIVAEFSDTSTGLPASWQWDFGDGGNSTSQNPTHVYSGAGMFSACLIASNAGGDSPQVCQNVTVTEEPSTTVAPASALDLDNDGQDDLLVESDSGCGVDSPNRFAPQNGAEAGALLEDYRSVVLADAQGAKLSDQLFCHPEADFDTTMVINSSNGFFYKLWTPENDGSGVRFVVELLGTPPAPPTAAFTFSSIDLIADFTDQSTGVVTSWSWDFDDGNTAGSPDVTNIYASADTYTVCLVVSNAGGDSAPACQDVTVAEVPSTDIASGTGIDLDGDSLDDLLTELSGCGGIHRFVVQNGSQRSAINTFYPDVVLNDAQTASYDTLPFCHPVADPDSTILVISSDNRFFKAWTPENDGSGVRMQFEELGGVTPTADLTISLSDSVDPVVAGTTLVITAEVTNNGSFTADKVSINFNFPPELTPVSTSGCNEDPAGTPDCGLGSLTSGQSATVDVNVEVDPGSSGQLSTSATVSSSTQDPVPSNDSAQETTVVQAEVELSLDKSSNSFFTPVGGTIIYSIVIENTGTSDAVDARVEDIVPAELDDVSWMCMPSAGSACAASGMGSIDELVTVASGGFVGFVLQGTLQDTDPDPITITNTATVTAPPGAIELVTSDNSDSDTDIVGLFADGMESVEPN
ncbi:MAG: PKD domain-containing protein [Pseudomonadota bacterium]